MLSIETHKIYTSQKGRRLKVTAHLDWADEVIGVVLDDNGRIVDFFKTNYQGFCQALNDSHYLDS